MVQSIFKIFFSKKKEAEWLNLMGSSGYRLSRIDDSKYMFEFSENHFYSYSIEHLGYSPESESAVAYYEKCKEKDIYPIVSSGNWVYFVCEDKPIEISFQSYKKNSMFYFWRVFYLMFFALCGAIVCGYQAFAIGYLERIGQQGNGQIRFIFEVGSDNSIINGMKMIGNFFIEMTNYYFKVWASVFGESDAVAVIAVIAPITLTLLIFAGFNLNEFLIHRSLSKLYIKNQPLSEEGTMNAK